MAGDEDRALCEERRKLYEAQRAPSAQAHFVDVF